MNERTGSRDLTYSRWHRSKSIARYVGPRRAAVLKVIDIDWCEACNACSQPLALIETVRGGHPGSKPSTITENLAVMAGIDAFSLGYEVEGDDIVRFRYLRLVTDGVPVSGVVYDLTPQEWAQLLVDLRTKHARACRSGRAAS